MMKRKMVRGVVQCCAVTALFLGGAAVSEASTLTLTSGDSSVELCVPESPTVNSCASTGLFNWVTNGVTSPFQQWLSFNVTISPDWGHESTIVSWSGAIDELSIPTVTQPTASTASISYMNWNLGTWPYASSPLQAGIAVDYALTDPSGGPAHITETIKMVNPTYYYYYAGLSDGIGINVENLYVYPYSEVTLATADYTPNPEPMSMVLLGTGLLAVVSGKRRLTALA
jgi:hypothetical protein